MSFGRKHLYSSTRSFSVARTSSFRKIPLNGSARTTSLTHRMAQRAQRGLICVTRANLFKQSLKRFYLKINKTTIKYEQII